MSVKRSLEENQDEILKNLPEEFHADFKKQLAETKDEDLQQRLEKKEVQELVASVTPEDLKEEAYNIDSEIEAKTEGASQEEQHKQILDSLPDELKDDYKKEHGL